MSAVIFDTKEALFKGQKILADLSAKQKTKLQQEVDEMIAYLTIWKINVAKEKKRVI